MSRPTKDLSTHYLTGLHSSRLLCVSHVINNVGRHCVGISDTTEQKVSTIDLSLGMAEELGFVLLNYVYRLESKRWRNKTTERFEQRLNRIVNLEEKDTPMTEETTAPQPCDHKFVYVGVRYRDGRMDLPGTGAKNRYYGHVYKCERCLESRTEMIERENTHNTYYPLAFNATPAAGNEVELPSYEKTRY